MALKRDLDSLVYSDTEEAPVIEPNKRQKKQTSNRGKRQPAVDPTYGQKWAFSVTEGLGAPSDDDLEFEDQSEALEYLRSVQKETSRIPHVVAAPKAGPQLPPGYTLPPADDAYDGYYYDGAYTAAPDYVSSDEEEGELYSDSDPDVDPTPRNRAALQEAYFTSLTTRFTTLRARLHQPPPQSALDRLPPDHETEVSSFAPSKKPNTFRTWTHRIRYTDPLPAQLAAMDKTSVLRLLRVVLGGKFFRRGCALRRRTSQWIWALLARLPDRGELDADEVGLVREMGKRAVLVSISREHVAALCEVLGREQVVAFGLNGVLHEIEGRVDERKVDVGEDGPGELPLLEDGQLVNEDEILLTPDEDDPPARLNGTSAAVETDIDLEDGELAEEVHTIPEPQPTADGVDEGEMGMDLEEGEVFKEPSPDPAKDAAIAALKARLLSELDHVATWEEPPASPPAAKKPADDPITDLVNMRATVNMILTVAGEFYGQRDLLVFRDPFGDVPFETNDDDE
ncbi:hypothetical protein CONLIGDRAFT_299855 [Coniochaeta ligniaria NRRL 30616]|uniref:Uncharacterized protein n=1 Tax=Coniochaeta ligniaria NRRL 30616 TaxID=1408157 RepID=A0A1J7IV96_9PEZI|nr:hypothetical protein CONLIGDRAFT_299855 [Coniochaeta ligniaria NRRL 30616]